MYNDLVLKISTMSCTHLPNLVDSIYTSANDARFRDLMHMGIFCSINLAAHDCAADFLARIDSP
jgi:hypothetical protein